MRAENTGGSTTRESFELLLEILSSLFGHIRVPLGMDPSAFASGDFTRVDDVEDALQPYGAVREIMRSRDCIADAC